MRLTLEEVLLATGGTAEGRGSAAGTAPPGSMIVTGVSTDTRALRPGDLFVPLRGPNQDGHQYIGEAFVGGAVASLAVRAAPDPRVAVTAGAQGGPIIRVDDTLQALARLARYYRRTLPVQVVAITGSVGKTATASMCAAVLGTRYRVVRTKDEWNAEIGVPLTILSLGPNDDVAVIEMAMRGLGQIADLVDIASPQIGVVTTIGESHLELLGTLENVARAKGELIDGLPPDGTAVLNADDERVLGLGEHARARVVTFAVDRPADVRAEGVAFTPEGMRCRIRCDDGAVGVLLHAWGTHSVRHALAAAAVARTMNVGLDAVRDGLGRWVAPQMRLQPVPLGDVLLINDAYNASPTSMAAAFEVLDRMAGARRRIAVLGEMKELGAQSAAMHREVGRSAARVVSVLITVGGDDAAALAEGASAGSGHVAVHRVASTAGAAQLLRDLLRPHDVVLVKGSRAMAMEQVVAALIDARGSDRP